MFVVRRLAIHSSSRLVFCSHLASRQAVVKIDFHGLRGCTSGASPPPLTLQQAVVCQRLIVETLSDDALQEKLANSVHDHVRGSGHCLVARWQRVLTIVQMVKTEAISRHGFPANAHGLLQYEKQLALLSVSDGQPCLEEQVPEKELSALRCQAWDIVLSKAFDVSCFRRVSVAEARKITAHLVLVSSNEGFLRRVDSLMQKFDKRASTKDKHSAVLDLVVPLHMGVLSEYGFHDDSGYVAFFAALMEHVIDETVANQMMSASAVVFKRAGLVSQKRTTDC